MTSGLDSYDFDANLNLWMRPDQTSIDYSDGDANEARMLRVLRETTDKSTLSNELEFAISDWPSEYHFSQKRANLLRHLPFRPGLSILELGGGCGAITRFLGESGATVTTIEGALPRARCAAERTRNLPNVRIYCADFSEIDFDPVYDFVILVGVLEYAPVFFGHPDPFGRCLAVAKGALVRGGRLVIAIENRNGIKYFNGCGEDHTCRVYSGITDCYGPREPRTFGRGELTRLLANAGLPAIEFHYPFPDYKLPTVVLTDLAFLADDFAPHALISQTHTRDYCGPHKPLFDERLAWPQLVANDLARELANSFLVLASQEPDATATVDGLAYAYNLGEAPDHLRRSQFKTATAFTRGKDAGNIVVSKQTLGANGLPCALVAHSTGLDEPYVPGPNIADLMLRALARRDWDAFDSLLAAWIQFVVRHGNSQPAESTLMAAIKPDFFECLPSNLIAYAGELVFVDREWRFHRQYTVCDLILRGLTHFCDDNHAMLCTAVPPGKDPLTYLAARGGLNFSAEARSRIRTWEAEFYDSVFLRPPGSPHRHPSTIRSRLRRGIDRIFGFGSRRNQ